MEFTLWGESSMELERQMSMAVVHSNSVDSNLSAEEEAELLLRLSSTSPAVHSINSGADSFSFFSGLTVPVDRRLAPYRLFEESDERPSDSERSGRTRDEERCFESIMWSVKEISCDFQTACIDCDEDDIDRCLLSETWFQKDARHFDEQQKRKRALMKREQEQLRRGDKLEDLCPKQQLTMSFEKDHQRYASLQLVGEDGRRREVPSFPLVWIQNMQRDEDQRNDNT